MKVGEIQSSIGMGTQGVYLSVESSGPVARGVGAESVPTSEDALGTGWKEWT